MSTRNARGACGRRARSYNGSPLVIGRTRDVPAIVVMRGTASSTHPSMEAGQAAHGVLARP
jgi:hypothetical protein